MKKGQKKEMFFKQRTNGKKNFLFKLSNDKFAKKDFSDVLEIGT